MRLLIKLLLSITVFCFIFSFQNLEGQTKKTKKLKRPSSRVGIASVDSFVGESFNLYDKVYMYDGYAAAGTPLKDEDLDVLEAALEDVSNLSASAPDILSDLDGVGVLKQSKATLQINRAKKALKYSIKTAKKLLTTKREQGEDESQTDQTVSANEGNDNSSSDNSNGSTSSSNDSNSSSTKLPEPKKDIKIYSKFGFVPGDKLLFYDDYSNDFIGDFPSKWNTNGSGEIVTINESKQRWLQIQPGYSTYYIPDVELPEEYTIEFDLLTSGLDKKTSSQAKLRIVLSEGENFSLGNNYARASLPFGQFADFFGIRMQNYINRGGGGVNNVIKADIRKEVLNKPHISIAVNKLRFRLWVNEKKYVDIPRLMPPGAAVKNIKFQTENFKDGQEFLFITNLKVAEGGVDLRRQLINEGTYSTNGILFDSGSANIQPQSYGIIRQISQALLQVKDMKLNIIGHTDADGPDDTNLKLSKERAEAVKNALINIYNISGDRLQTEGKGESIPLGDNKTTDGKAQNRRVEFVKI